MTHCWWVGCAVWGLVQVLTGKIIRYDEVRGYGFILPAAGGEDVFFHANDLGEHRHAVRVGARVEYEVEEGDRGFKVAEMRLAEPVRPATEDPTEPDGDDDGLCDVLRAAEFRAEVTELLLEHAPSLTGIQIQAVRQALVTHARSHGWVES